MPQHLLFVVQDVAFFLSHRLPVARAAVREGYRVTVAGPSGPAVQGLKDLGFAFEPVSFSRKGMNLLAESRSVLALVRLFRRLKPDLIHLVAMKPCLYGGIAARVTACSRVVFAFTGLGFLFLSSGPTAALRRWMLRPGFRFGLRAPGRRAIFQNPDDRALFLADRLLRPEQAVLILGSGVDPDRFHPTPEPEGVPIVLLASRLLHTKGVREFVQAAHLLHKRQVKARFVLVGEPDPGNPTTVTQTELQAWVAEGVVEHWGHRKDMPQVHAQATVVCLPSYSEGVPKVLIEAAACGRPIVTTDIPGCREIVKHEVNGLLVPPRTVEPLADALTTLLSEPERRATYAAAGRTQVLACFSEAIVVQGTLQTYAELHQSPSK